MDNEKPHKWGLGPKYYLVGAATLFFLILGIHSQGYRILAYIRGEPSWDGEPLSYWLVALSGKDPHDPKRVEENQIQEKAVAALAKLGSKAVPGLIEVLKTQVGHEHSPSDVPGVQVTHVGVMAAVVLGRIGRDAGEAKASLTITFKQRGGVLRARVAEALWRITGEIKPLVAAALDRCDFPDEDDRSNQSIVCQSLAATILVHSRKEADTATPLLLGRLKSGNPISVRLWAAAVLGDRAPLPREVIEALRACREEHNQDPHLEFRCSYGLASVGCEACDLVPYFIAIIKDPEFPPVYLRPAIWALGNIGSIDTEGARTVMLFLDSEAFKPKVPATPNRPPQPGEGLPLPISASDLGIGSTPEEVGDPDDKRESQDVECVVWALSRISPVNILIDALGHPETYVKDEKDPVRKGTKFLRIRRGVAQALGRMDWKTAGPELEKALAHDSAHVREWSAKALGKMGIRAHPARLALMKAIDDPNPRVKVKAAVAVWKVTGEAEQTERILKGVLQQGEYDSDIELVAKAILQEMQDRRK